MAQHWRGRAALAVTLSCAASLAGPTLAEEAGAEDAPRTSLSIPADVLDRAIVNAEGETFRLADYADSLVALVFRSLTHPNAAPWIDVLDTLASDYEARGLAFAGYDMSGLPERYAKLLLERQGEPPYPIVIQGGREFARLLGVYRAPALAVLDLRNGTDRAELVFHYAPGVAPLVDGDDPAARITESLDRLLAGEPASQEFVPRAAPWETRDPRHRLYVGDRAWGWEYFSIPPPEGPPAGWRPRRPPALEPAPPTRGDPREDQGQLRAPIYWGAPIGR